MASEKLTEKVTIEREVKGTIRDLVMFVKYLREQGHFDKIPDNEVLIQRANDFWEREHGDEHG